jgi:hypothetical protein
MSQTINCSSCGAANQLPEGRTSMFCSFCGSSIQTPVKNNILDIESSIKVKPEISKRKTENKQIGHYDNTSPTLIRYEKEEVVTDEGGELSLINRGLKSLDEITLWFSDNELKEVKNLILSKNKINNLKGLYRFKSLKKLDLSDNQIENLDLFNDENNKIKKLNLSGNNLKSLKGISKISIPNRLDISNNDISCFDEFPIFVDKSSIEFNFSNNRNLLEFSTEVINEISQMIRVDFVLLGCEKFNFNNFGDIILKNKNVTIHLKIEPNKNLPQSLLNIGFKKIDKYCTNKSSHWLYLNESQLISEKKSGCFIATATMGSYENPKVMELRYFRDNWILQKSWGESFVIWYYHYGAIAAKIIEKSSILKKISYLFIVKPLICLSRIVKK